MRLKNKTPTGQIASGGGFEVLIYDSLASSSAFSSTLFRVLRKRPIPGLRRE